jgi:hypothetical protein
MKINKWLLLCAGFAFIGLGIYLQLINKNNLPHSSLISWNSLQHFLFPFGGCLIGNSIRYFGEEKSDQLS